MISTYFILIGKSTGSRVLHPTEGRRPQAADRANAEVPGSMQQEMHTLCGAFDAYGNHPCQEHRAASEFEGIIARHQRITYPSSS
jgi:hypothetical protein